MSNFPETCDMLQRMPWVNFKWEEVKCRQV